MQVEDPEWSPFLEAAFIAVLEAADEGIIVFDREGRCRMIGRRIGEMFGIDPGQHVGSSRTEVLKVLSESCEEPEAFMATVGVNDLLEAPKIFSEIELRKPKPRTLLWTSFPAVRDGEPWGRLGLVRDVTRELRADRTVRQLQAKLDEFTPVDPMTGLPNFRRFHEELEREHGRSSRAWDGYAVLRIDIEGMGAINEELGRPVGDAILERVAERLRLCKRDYDVVARFRDDDFVALLPGADAVAARAVAERMQTVIHGERFDLNLDRPVTLAIGASVWSPRSAYAPDEMVERADAAMRSARAQGKGQVRIDEG